MAAIITPIIHLNGDRKEVLAARLEATYDAIRAAQDVLRECAPNGRNFYPEPGRFEKAQAQHRARQEALQSVMESLEAEMVQMDRDTRNR